MIVNIRVEISDQQRNQLARLNKPTAPARLATRAEVHQYVSRALARLDAPQPADPEPASEQPAPMRGRVSVTTAAQHVTNAMHSLGAAVRKLEGLPEQRDARGLAARVEDLWRMVAERRAAEEALR